MDQKEIKVGESRYYIQQLPAQEGLEVMFAVTRILSGMAEGVGETSTGLGFMDTSLNFGKMAAGVIARTDVLGTPQLIKRIVRGSVVKPDVSAEGFDFDAWFDEQFAGRYVDLWDLVGEIMTFNRYDEIVKKKLPAIIDALSQDSPSSTGEDRASTPSTSRRSPRARGRSAS